MIDKMIDRWCTQIYYEESAHVIMEAGKPHSLLSAVWGPRIADGVWVWRSANQEHWWCNSPSEGRRRLIPTQTVRQRGRSFPFSMVLLHSGPQRTGWGPPTLGREICFTQSNLISSGNRHTQKWCLPTSGHPVTQTHWHIKLAITVCQGLLFPWHPLVCQCFTGQLADQVRGRTVAALFCIEGIVLGFMLLN